MERPDSRGMTVPAAIHLVVKLDQDLVALACSLFRRRKCLAISRSEVVEWRGIFISQWRQTNLVSIPASVASL